MNKIILEDAQKTVSDYIDMLEKLQGKTVYVAGATGMVGSYLVFALMQYASTVDLKSRPSVIAGVRNKTKAEALFVDYLGEDNFRICEKDVVEVTSQDIGAVDYIIHAASSATPTHFRNDPVGIINSNVIGTERLLDIARENDARFCFISTLEVYGEVAKDGVDGITKVTEEDYGSLDTLDLRSAYPESKRLAENLCVAYGAQYGVDTVIARLSHTYGPGMGLNDTRVQTQFIKSALNGEGITLLSDGTSKRTYTYIADGCAAILKILIDGEQGEAYNIANEAELVSIGDLARTILRHAGLGEDKLTIDIPRDSANMWSRATGLTTLDATKLCALGWKANTDIDSGIQRTLAYHKEEL